MPSASDSRSARTYWLFNAALLPLWPALALYTLWRRYRQGRSAASLRGQWGRVPPEVVQALDGGGPRLWLHAVSVGETMAARPIARALRQAMPDCRIAQSVTTDTGYEAAQAALKAGEIDAVFYFPLDLPLTVSRALRVVRPDAFLTVETELWPNFLHLARRCGARTLLVNGRVSDNLMRQAPRLRGLWAWMMGNLDAALMRSRFDAERLEQLPSPPRRVEVTGDVKLDNLPPGQQGTDLRGQWRATLGIAPTTPLWVAGSTHSGEETAVLNVYQTLRRDLPALRLVLAPRHIERAAEVVQLAQALDVPPARRSQMSQMSQMSGPPPDDAVIVLDTVGELAQVYAAADVTFVGGSLIERGGHNLLEPVLRGVPVVFGPHTANFREAAALAQNAGVGVMVPDETALCEAVRRWLTDDAERAAVAERADAALAEHRGAAARVARIVAEALGT